MKALVSGQASLAVLFDGDHISSLHYDRGESVPRLESDIPYLLADATDVVELVDVTRDAAAEALDLACRKDEGLHLLLILLDSDADTEARQMAAECLEELLRDPGVSDFVANRLYAAPLPGVSDLVGALIYADRVGASRLANFLEALGSYQPGIRRWRAAWDALPLGLFGKPRTMEEFGHLVVTSGSLRKLVQSDPEDIDGLLYHCLTDPGFQALPNHRRILMDLIGPFRPVKKSLRLEPESKQEEEDFTKPRRPRHGAEKPRRSFIVFETVNRQKEAVKRLLSEGNADRALKYVDDLVEYQKSRSEIEDLVKSLCDLAKHAKEIGGYGIQLNLAQRAVKMLPSDGWSHAQLGDAYLCLDQYEHALKAYDVAYTYGEARVARNGRAEVLKAMGRLDEALEEYDSAAQEFPHDAVVLNGRAEVLKAMGRLDEALEEYKSAAREFPHDVVVRIGRIGVLKAMGRLDEALEEYDSAAREFPHDVVVRNCRAEVLKAMGRLDEALEEYDSAAQEFPHDVVVRNGRAEVLKAMGRLDEALEEYKSAAREFPHDVVVRTGQAGVLKAMGRLDEALEEYESAAREFPHNVVVRNGRAEVLKTLGRLDEALEEYDSAAQEFPHDVVVRNGRAEVLKAMGRLDEALKEYESTAQVFPHDVVVRTGLAGVLKVLGRFDEAVEQYETIVEKSPGDLYALNGKASVLALLGRYGEALKFLPSGPPRTLGEWIAFHIRGMVLLKQGNLDTAIELFEHGVLQNPWRSERSYFRSGLAVARLQRREFQKAVQVVGDDPTPVCNVLRIHAFGGLGEIEKAEDALNRVKNNRLPNLVLLRDELAAQYVSRLSGHQQRSDEWVFQQECDLLLAA